MPGLLLTLAVLYGLLGVCVGVDVADANRGLHPLDRRSPWLRGALWPVFVLLGALVLACGVAAEALQRRR